MFYRTSQRLVALVSALLIAACADYGSTREPGDLVGSGPVPTRSVAVSADPTPSPPGEESAGNRDDAGFADDCAAYVDAGGWCQNGIGDYDCKGGGGNGPNYAPRDIEVVRPGVDPFRLDRNDDGKACESHKRAPEPEPEPEPKPEPEPEPEPETDRRFGTCGEATAAGYGPYYRGQDPEYDWYRDADGDGVVCE